MKSRLQQVVDPLSSTLAGTGRQGSPFRAFFFSSPSPFASFLPLVFELIESVGGAEASSSLWFSHDNPVDDRSAEVAASARQQGDEQAHDVSELEAEQAVVCASLPQLAQGLNRWAVSPCCLLPPPRVVPLAYQSTHPSQRSSLYPCPAPWPLVLSFLCSI